MSKKTLIKLINNNNIYKLNLVNKEFVYEKNTNELLSAEEEIMFKEAIAEIIPNTKEAKYAKTDNIYNKEIKVYKDNNNNYFWKEDNPKINKILNLKYNHLQEQDAIKTFETQDDMFEDEEDEEYYTKQTQNGIVKVLTSLGYEKLLTIGVIVVAGLFLVAMGQSIYNDIMEKKLIKQNQYSFSKIETIIDENENLTEEEKKSFKNLKFVFDDYHNYMNMGMIENRLKNISIKYIDGPNILSPEEQGNYSSIDNKIKYYNSSSKDDVNISCYYHELIHVLQIVKENDGLFEVTTEQFTIDVVNKLYEDKLIDEYPYKNENSVYSDAEIIGYQHMMPFFYRFANIIPREELLKYQFQTDREELSSIFKSKEAKISFSRYLNVLNELRDCNLSNVKSTIEENEKIIDEIMEPMYLDIKGISVKEDVDYQLINFNTRKDKDEIAYDYLLSTIFSDVIREYTKGEGIIYRYSHKAYFLGDKPSEVNYKIIVIDANTKRISDVNPLHLKNTYYKEDGFKSFVINEAVKEDFKNYYNSHKHTKSN